MNIYIYTYIDTYMLVLVVALGAGTKFCLCLAVSGLRFAGCCLVFTDCGFRLHILTDRPPRFLITPATK